MMKYKIFHTKIISIIESPEEIITIQPKIKLSLKISLLQQPIIILLGKIMFTMRQNRLISKNKKEERQIKLRKLMIFKNHQSIIPIKRSRKLQLLISAISRIMRNLAKILVVMNVNQLIYKLDKSSQFLKIILLLSKEKEINHLKIPKINQ